MIIDVVSNIFFFLLSGGCHLAEVKLLLLLARLCDLTYEQANIWQSTNIFVCSQFSLLAQWSFIIGESLNSKLSMMLLLRIIKSIIIVRNLNFFYLSSQKGSCVRVVERASSLGFSYFIF